MASRPRIVVVGLGPAGPELIDRATSEIVEGASICFLRTRRHPAAVGLTGVATFDEVYDGADELVDVYTTIVERLVASATEHGEVVYAVPGSPLVAERTVELLRADTRVDVEVHPALSFLDLAWNQLGVDPLASGVRLVDGQRFATEAVGERGPLLVAQCDSRSVLSDIKLVLDGSDELVLDPTAAITVLQRLGTPDASVVEVAWIDLDRDIEPDHLTTLWIPTLEAPIAREVARFADLVVTLRRACPWDREQTHQSLMRHLVEETYEVLEAIEHVDPETGAGYEHLEEELGDLLFQVVFHATLAAEAGQFTLADVATTIHDKLYRRHPHVFGDVDVDGADDVVRNWEQIKKEEKGRESVFEGIPSSLPALLLALKVQKKASNLAERGVDLPTPPTMDQLVDEMNTTPDVETVGALLFAIAELAHRAGTDPEAALRAYTSRYRERVMQNERTLPH